MHFKICNSHFYRKNPSRKFRFKPDGFLCWEFVLKTSILNNSDFQWENLSCKVHNSSTTRIFGAKVRVAKCKLWKIYRYPIWANSLHLFLQFSFHLQVAVKLTISVQTNKQKRGCQISILFRLLKLYLNPGDRKSPILSWSFASLKTHGEYIH